jgi:hypothetical protein
MQQVRTGGMSRTNKFFNVGKRDKNESMITEVLDYANLRYKLLPPGFGADILILDWMSFIEVKNPEQIPSKRKLTQDELELQKFCEENGTAFDVVETPEEMADIIGTRLQ